MPLPARRSGRFLPYLLAFAAFVALLSLGFWQLDRKASKEALLAKLAERLAAAPTPLPPQAAWARLDRAAFEFRRVRFSAEFLHENEALVYSPGSTLRVGAPTGPGYLVFTPARLAGGGVVMVNRGFAPEARRKPQARSEGQVAGQVEIEGVMRWPEAASTFSPDANPAANLWFVRDPGAIAAAKGLAAAPFYVEQEAPAPPGGWPQPARLEPKLRNNHLQYAVTWFGLAFALVIVVAVWARGRGSPSR